MTVILFKDLLLVIHHYFSSVGPDLVYEAYQQMTKTTTGKEIDKTATSGTSGIS